MFPKVKVASNFSKKQFKDIVSTAENYDVRNVDFAKIAMNFAQAEQSKKMRKNGINWKRIRNLMNFRTMWSKFRGERWIRRAWRLSECKNLNISDFMKKSNVIYFFGNVNTKKGYVGQTARELWQRYQSHWYELEKMSQHRLAYKYIKSIGSEHWFMIPLEIVERKKNKNQNLKLLLEKEQKWMNIFGCGLINDPATLPNNNNEKKKK